MIDGLLRSVRLAIRRFFREPGISAAAILTLAVGIGACTAMFSVVQAVLLQSLGVAAPERLAVMWPQSGDTAGEFALNEYLNLQKETTVFEGLGITGSTNWSAEILRHDGTRLKATRCVVSGNFFDVLGSRPRLGRTFRPEDDVPGARAVVVLSAGFWEKHFGGDPGAIGRTLTTLENATAGSAEIVGVMPAEFFYPTGADYWAPAVPALITGAGASSPADIAQMFDRLGVFHAVGRLKPGVTRQAAELDASRAWKAKAGTIVDAATLADARAGVKTRDLLEQIFGQARQALVVLMGAVLLVLFVACANVAGLLIAKGAARARELAVRRALGATTWQLSRQFVAEGAVLAAIGGALGVSVAGPGLRALIALSPAAIPRLDSARVDASVLAFSVVAMLVTTILIGVIPALQFRGRAIVSQLHGSGARTVSGSVRAGVRQMLVVTQVAVALVLLVASALVVQTFWKLANLDLGFNPSHVLTFGVRGLDESRHPTYARRHQVVEQLVARFDRVPGVQSSAAVLSRPFAHGTIGWDSGLLLDGQVDSPATLVRNPTANWEAVTPRYFEAMGIRLVRGRAFTAADRRDAPLVAIVSEKLAAQAWPGQNPLGKRLRDSFVGGGTEQRGPSWQTVVGVVATARYRDIARPSSDLYVPLVQADTFDVEHFVVRTAGEPRSVTKTIEVELAAVDPGLSIDEPTTMEDVVGRVRAPWQFNMLMFTLFGAVSIGLTAIGIFGLVAYTVTWRRREIGVRMALGARHAQVIRMIMFQAGRLVGIGIAVGLVTCLLAARLVSSLLFEMSPTDPGTLALAAAGVFLLASAACYIPALRVSRLNPSIVFRDE